ncbi:phage virion morphogenesis protein [Viscerimonas tarda]
MELKDLKKQLESIPKKMDELIKNKMPNRAGRMAVQHFRNNFRESGFVDGGLHPWKKSKRQESGKKSAGSNYKTLTSGRNHLMMSTRYVASSGAVTIINNLDYASIHNDGGTINSHPAVTPKMRKFAWAQYFKALGVKKGKKLSKNMTIPEDAAKWKRLALTKKTKLNIKIVMPKRQFIGDSRELQYKINAKLDTELEKIIF